MDRETGGVDGHSRWTGALTIVNTRQLLVGLVAVLSAWAVTGATDETIINKRDTDRIFSFDQTEWENYARHLSYPPGWKARIQETDTGTSVMAFNQSTGMGLSIQPIFLNGASRPSMLIIGNYYPSGTVESISEEARNHIQAAAERDLGPEYLVSASFETISRFDAELDVVELVIQKTE